VARVRYNRAWVSTGAAGAWHPPKFWTSPLAPADFEVLNTNWHPQSSFYVKSGTLSFKFLTQALVYTLLVEDTKLRIDQSYLLFNLIKKKTCPIGMCLYHVISMGRQILKLECWIFIMVFFISPKLRKRESFIYQSFLTNKNLSQFWAVKKK